MGVAQNTKIDCLEVIVLDKTEFINTNPSSCLPNCEFRSNLCNKLSFLANYKHKTPEPLEFDNADISNPQELKNLYFEQFQNELISIAKQNNSNYVVYELKPGTIGHLEADIQLYNIDYKLF